MKIHLTPLCLSIILGSCALANQQQQPADAIASKSDTCWDIYQRLLALQDKAIPLQGENSALTPITDPFYQQATTRILSKTSSLDDEKLRFLFAMLISRRYEQLELIWLKSPSREVRLYILMLIHGCHSDTDISFIPQFESSCARFAHPESAQRYEELILVLKQKKELMKAMIPRYKQSTTPTPS